MSSSPHDTLARAARTDALLTVDVCELPPGVLHVWAPRERILLVRSGPDLADWPAIASQLSRCVLEVLAGSGHLHAPEADARARGGDGRPGVDVSSPAAPTRSRPARGRSPAPWRPGGS